MDKICRIYHGADYREVYESIHALVFSRRSLNGTISENASYGGDIDLGEYPLSCQGKKSVDYQNLA